MLIRDYSDISISRTGVRNDLACGLRWGAHFKIKDDIRRLFPFINGTVDGTCYHHRPLHVRFEHQGVSCTLYPTEGMAAPFKGQTHAIEYIEDLIVFLNDMYARRHDLKPSHKVYRTPVSIVDIVKALPKTNCKACGYSTCMAFAAALSNGETSPGECPGFSKPISVCTVYPVLRQDGTVESTFSIETEPATAQRPTEGSLAKGSKTGPKVVDQYSKSPLFDRNGVRIQYDLTSREIEVLRFVAEGASNPRISKMLNISPHTVKSHVIHIFNKLNVNDRTQAAVWAVQNRII